MEENPYVPNRTPTSNIDRESQIGSTGGIGQSSFSGGSMQGSLRRSWQDASPEEVRQMVKDRVAKGIAAVTGALEGFIERSRQGELAQKTHDALGEAGHTAREAVRGTSEQLDRTRQTMKQEGIGQKAKEAMHEVTDTARRVGQSAKEELNKTKQELGSKGGGQGQQGGSSSVQGVPDISHTKLGTQEDIRKSERQ